MLRVLNTICQSLLPLPRSRVLCMNLFYYDDVTPPAWEPKFFRRAKQHEADRGFEGGATPLNLKIGELELGASRLKFKVQTLQDTPEATEETHELLGNPELGDEEAGDGDDGEEDDDEEEEDEDEGGEGVSLRCDPVSVYVYLFSLHCT